MSAPLLVTADPTLRDDLLRLAAAAGVTPDVAVEPAEALRHWASAPLVLVGADLAPALAELAPGRRDAVHVVCWSRAADDLFRIALALGAQDVTELPRSEAWVVEALTDVGDRARAPGVVIGVVGGSGGAGATTLACALGQTAARRGDAVVLDCDPLGPGVDTVLGLDDVDGFRWDALCQTTGRFSARALREALPRRDSLGVLTWHPGSAVGLQAFAVREALSAARRGHAHVVVDLPRSADPLVEEVGARCDVLLVVVVPTVAGRGLGGAAGGAAGRPGLGAGGAAGPRARGARGRAGHRAGGARRRAAPAGAGRVGRPGPRSGALAAGPAGPHLPRAARRVRRGGPRAAGGGMKIPTTFFVSPAALLRRTTPRGPRNA